MSVNQSGGIKVTDFIPHFCSLALERNDVYICKKKKKKCNACNPKCYNEKKQHNFCSKYAQYFRTKGGYKSSKFLTLFETSRSYSEGQKSGTDYCNLQKHQIVINMSLFTLQQIRKLHCTLFKLLRRTFKEFCYS